MVQKLRKIARKTVKKARKIVPILGVGVDSTTKRRVLEEILRFLSIEAESKLFIVTPNPEILVQASDNPIYKSILQSASLALPDGIGVVMAQKYVTALNSSSSRFRLFDLVRLGLQVGFAPLLNRQWLFSEGEVVPGRVVFEDLIKLALENGWRVFLLGGKPGVGAQAVERILNKYTIPDSRFTIQACSGPWLDKEGRPVDQKQAQIEQETIKQINTFKPHLLFVAFGPPKQEFWLAHNLPKLNIRTAMVVGGSLDYAAGIVPAPPMWISRAGFEWLWRLVSQPWRAKRIATALFVFPWKVFLYSLQSS